jgi:hypothetical protein
LDFFAQTVKSNYRSALALTLAASISILLTACGGGGGSAQTTNLGIQLKIISGDNQVGSPTHTFPESLVVKVVDGSGNGVSGVPVYFSVVPGDTPTATATLTLGNSVTAADGTSRVQVIAPGGSNSTSIINVHMELSDAVTQFHLITRSYPDAPLMTLFDATTSSIAYAMGTTVGLNITNGTEVVKWCVSETQTTRPGSGSSQCANGAGVSNGWFVSKPLSFNLSAINGVKTVYIWVADQYDQVNLLPTTASIFLDTVAPGTPFIVLTDIGTGVTTDTSQAQVNIAISNDGDASYWCIITDLAANAIPTAPTRNDACWVTPKPTQVSMTGLGVNRTSVWLKDLAGNMSGTRGEQLINFTTATMADPSFVVQDPNTNSTLYARQPNVALTFTNDAAASRWCVSETQTTRPPTGLSTCTGGQGSYNGWTLTRPATFNLSAGNNTKTVYTWVANAFYNTSSGTVTQSITLDTIPPAIPIIDLLDPNTHQPNFTNQSSVQLSITSDTDATAWCVYEKAQAASPPSLPAFSDICWLAVRPTTVALGATGSRRVYLYTKDAAQNVTPAPAVGAITYTTTAPTDPILVMNDQLTNSTTLTRAVNVNVSINSPTGTVRWCLSETQTTRPATGSATCTGGTGPSSGWYTASPLTTQVSAGDAVKHVYVWVADGANNVNINPSPTDITLDLTPPATPVVVMKDPNTLSTSSTNQLQVTLQITGDTDATRWCRMMQIDTDPDPSAPALTDVCWVTTRPTTQYMDALGTRKLFVFTRDAAGNVGTPGSTTILYTTDAPSDPTITLADSTTSLSTYAKQTSMTLGITNDTGAVKWCVSETQSSRPTQGTNACAGGTGPSNGWLLAKPTTFALSNGDGVKRVYVWTTNDSNTVNYNPTFYSMTLDTVAPATPTIALSDPNTASAVNTNQPTVGLAIVGDTDATAWCTIEQPFAAAAPAQPAWNNACWVTSRPLTQTLSATGTRRVFLYTRDIAYNVSTGAASTSITYSTALPSTPTLAVSDATTSLTTYLRQNASVISVTGDSGAVKWCLSETQTLRPTLGSSQCDNGTGPANGWLTSQPTSFNVSTGDSGKTLYLWTANSSNTVSAAAATATITLDTIPPSVPFAQITDPVTSSTSITNTTTPNLSITLDTDAVSWCVIEQPAAAAGPAAPGWNSTCWAGVRPTTISLGATGNRRAYIYTKDVAQNVTPAASITGINFSITPPSDPVMVLTSSLSSTTITKDLVVATAIASPTGTVRWCLSETQTARPATGSATCNGGQGSSSGWSTSPPSTFTLSSGDGVKTVYVWVADGANNVNANPTSTPITLDTVAPATPVVSMTDPNTGSATNTNQVLVNLSITGDTDAYKWCRIMQLSTDPAPAQPSLNDVCWVTPRPTNVYMDATGSRSLYVFTRDLAGNLSASGSSTINYSNVAPNDPVLAITDSVTGLSTYAKSTATNLSIISDTGAVKWCVSETQNTRPNLGSSTCTGGTGPSSGWLLARPTTFTLSSGDGLKRVYVWTANSSNTVNSNPTSITTTLDTVVPLTASVILTDPNTGSSSATNQATVTMGLSGDTDATAWCSIEQAAATAAPGAPVYNHACWSTTRPTTQILGATGSRKVYVFTRDAAYNVSASSGMAAIAYNTTAPATPALAVTDGLTSLSTYTRQIAVSIAITSDTNAVKWCLSETQTARPALGTSNCAGGTGSSNGWLLARPTSFSLSTGDAAKTVYVWTADTANNTSASVVSSSITLDTTAPAVPLVSMSDPSTASTAFTNQLTVNLAITSDTGATAWCSLEAAAGAASPTAPLFNNACWVGTRPTTQVLGATGDRRVYVYTKDPAQNVSPAASIASINYSTTVPSDPVLVLSDTTTGSRLYTNHLSVAISINNPPGAVEWCLSETQSTKPASGTATCTGGGGPSAGWYPSMPSTLNLSAGDGSKTMYVWVANSANTVNANPSSATITMKLIAPPAPVVALNDPNTNSTTVTNQNNVTLTITNDAQATAWCALVRASAAAVSSTPATSDACWNLSRPVVASLGATGARAVDVFVRDAEQNISPVTTATITLDATAVADPTLAIADSTTLSAVYARSTAINLTIGNDAAATRWCVSETQSVKPALGTSTCVSGGGPSSGWYTVRPTSFTLSSGDGLKRVYVWAANASNNVNDNAVSQSITLDTVLPAAFTITGLTGGTDTTADAYLGTTTIPTVNWSSSTDATAYNVTIFAADGTTVVCAQQTTAALAYTFSGCSLTNSTTYKAKVVSLDAALNQKVATNSLFSFQVDLNPPGSFTISGIDGSQDTTADAWSGTSLPRVSWSTSTGASTYAVRVFAADGTTSVCPVQTKAAGTLNHDYSTTGCSPVLANNTIYNAQVVSTSIAGNSSTASNSLYLFRADLTSPTISITSQPAAGSISSSATFNFTGADAVSGVNATECSLDAAAYVGCTSTLTQSYSSLANGSHSFAVRVTDKVGFQALSSSTWNVDSTLPTAFTITGATGATDSTADAFLWNDNRITANWTASSADANYDVTILNADNSIACSTVTVPAGTLSYNFSTCPITYPLVYKIQVIAKRGYGTIYNPGAQTITTKQDTVTFAITSTGATVVAGSSVTINMSAALNGTAMTTGGLNPTFSFAGGTSAGTFGSVTDNGNGTYRVTMTGTVAGTTSQVSATTAAKTVGTVTTASVQVLVGGPSAITSTVSASKTTLTANGTDSATLTVTLRDSQNNLISSGYTLAATYTGGVSTLIISGSFTNAGSGVYTATVQGNASGSATSLSVTAGVVNLTPSPILFTVLAGPPISISASGPTTSFTNLCTGPYSATLRDFRGNLANAAQYTQISVGGLAVGNFSTDTDCGTTITQFSISSGGTTSPALYVVSRAPGSIGLTFTDQASSGALTTGTSTVVVTGTPAWIGGAGGLNYGPSSAISAKGYSDGQLNGPNGAYRYGSYLYVTDTTNNRIVRYNATTGLAAGWVGRLDSVEGLSGGCAGLATATGVTAGWCTGGSSQSSAGATNMDGMLNNPVGLASDGTYLYIADYGNSRIVRLILTTGEWAGWYGRRANGSAALIAGTYGDSSCTSVAVGSPTNAWCSNGVSSSSQAVTPSVITNWDGSFTNPRALQYYFDSAATKNYLYIADGGNRRVARMEISGSTIPIWEGWLGRTLNTAAPTGNATGYATAGGCVTAASTVVNITLPAVTSYTGIGTPGWCKGGSTTTLPAAAKETNWDGMFGLPSGLAIVGSYLVVADNGQGTNSTPGRLTRHLLTDGSFQGWAGRTQANCPGCTPATYNSSTGAVVNPDANCTAAAATDAGWCMGGTPTYIFNTRLTGLATDGTYFYVTNASTQVNRWIAATPVIDPRWIGRMSAQPTGGPAACLTTPLGQPTPGWCSGGSSRLGYNDGAFTSAQFLAVSGDNIYTPDASTHKIQTYSVSTGTTTGFIGAVDSVTPSTWANSFTPNLAIMGNSGFPDDYSFVANAGTGYTAATYPLGITVSGTQMFASDTSAHRLKKFKTTDGSFVGWFGAVSAILPNAPAACLDLTAGSITPSWCKGGTSAAGASGTAKMSSPRGLASDGTNLYVADSGNHRINKIVQADTTFLGWLGKTGVLTTTPNNGMDGYNAAESTICTGLTTGLYTTTWCEGGSSAAGAGDGQFNTPYGVAIQPAVVSPVAPNYLFVADQANKRIQKFNADDGSYVGWIGRINSSAGIANGNGSSLAAGACVGAGTAGTPGWCKGSTAVTANNGAGFNGFSDPRGVAYAGGFIYVADFTGNRIQKFDAVTGTFQGWIGIVGATVPSSNGPTSGLPAGGPTACVNTTVGNYTKGWCIGGVAQATAGSTYDGGFNGPQGVWSDGTYLYVVDTNNHRLTKHDAVTGAFLGWQGLINTVPTGPAGVCTGSGAIVEGATPTWCTGGTSKMGRALGGFFDPSSISGDSSFIYVIDGLNNRIQAIPK